MILQLRQSRGAWLICLNLISLSASICPPGLYGSRCSSICPTKCKTCTSQESCDSCRHKNRQPPDCQRCKKGFHGPICALPCQGCADCDAVTGACPQPKCDIPGVIPADCSTPCPDGTYGLHCRFSCPIPCAKACHAQTGECLKCNAGTAPKCLVDCKDGKFAEACSLHCPVNCKGGCSTVDRTCQLCAEGFKSLYCDQPCGRGQHGQNCRDACPARCKHGVCDPVSGACADCEPGFEGDRCERAVECKPGVYGEKCASKCPQTCSGSSCDRKNGSCFSCYPGTRGEFCDKPCLEGTFGDGCSKRCPERCRGECGAEKGECWQCQTGYRGLFCNTTCEEGSFGDKCAKRCSEFCANSLCNHTTGHCFQCNFNRTGPFCTEHKAEVDENTDQPPAMEAVFIFLGLITPVFLIGIPFCVYKCMSRKRRQTLLKKKKQKDDDMQRDTFQLQPTSLRDAAFMSSFHRQKYPVDAMKTARFENKIDISRDIEIQMGGDDISVKSTTVSLSSRSEFSSKMEVVISRRMAGTCRVSSVSEPRLRQTETLPTTDSGTSRDFLRESDHTADSEAQVGYELLQSDISGYSTTDSVSRATLSANMGDSTQSLSAVAMMPPFHSQRSAQAGIQISQSEVNTGLYCDTHDVDRDHLRNVCDEYGRQDLDYQQNVANKQRIEISPSLIWNTSVSETSPLVRALSDQSTTRRSSASTPKRHSFGDIHKEMASNPVFQMNKQIFTSPPPTTGHAIGLQAVGALDSQSIDPSKTCSRAEESRLYANSDSKGIHLLSSTAASRESRSRLKAMSTPCVGVSPTRGEHDPSLDNVEPMGSPSAPIERGHSAERLSMGSMGLGEFICGNRSPPKQTSDHWTIRRIYKLEPTGSVPSIQMPTMSRHGYSDCPNTPSSPSLTLSKMIYRNSPPASVERLSTSRSLTSPTNMLFDNLALNQRVQSKRSTLSSSDETQDEWTVRSFNEYDTFDQHISDRKPTKSSTSLPPIRSSVRMYQGQSSSCNPYTDCVDSGHTTGMSCSFDSHEPDRQTSTPSKLALPRRTSVRIHTPTRTTPSRKYSSDKIQTARALRRLSLSQDRARTTLAPPCRRSPEAILRLPSPTFSDGTKSCDSLHGLSVLEQSPGDIHAGWHFYPAMPGAPVPSPAAHHSKPKVSNIIRCSTTRQVSPSRNTSSITSNVSDTSRHTPLPSSSYTKPTPPLPTPIQRRPRTPTAPEHENISHNRRHAFHTFERNHPSAIRGHSRSSDEDRRTSAQTLGVSDTDLSESTLVEDLPTENSRYRSRRRDR